MAASEALKIEREKRKAIDAAERWLLIRELMRNPLVELILLYVIIETLQTIPSPFSKETGAPIIPSKAGTAAEAAGIAAIWAQQLAPLMPSLTEGAAKIIGSLTPLTALLR